MPQRAQFADTVATFGLSAKLHAGLGGVHGLGWHVGRHQPKGAWRQAATERRFTGSACAWNLCIRRSTWTSSRVSRRLRSWHGQRLFHRMADRLVHLAAVSEAQLDLGRVYVDVDPGRVHCQVQRIDRLAVAVQHVFIGGACGVGEHLVAHKAAVDIGKLLVGS